MTQTQKLLTTQLAGPPKGGASQKKGMGSSPAAARATARDVSQQSHQAASERQLLPKQPPTRTSTQRDPTLDCKDTKTSAVGSLQTICLAR